MVVNPVLAKSPTAKSTLPYTGSLKVKYVIKQCQLRKYHEAANYASALFRYQNQMSIKYRKHATFVSLDDKHKVPAGEPGYSVASVERGKKCLLELIGHSRFATMTFVLLTNSKCGISY